MRLTLIVAVIFFFKDAATTEIYTLSLHDALPIAGADLALARRGAFGLARLALALVEPRAQHLHRLGDRKSTRLNSSHPSISYAVFCLKKKRADLPHAHPSTIR